MSSYILPDIPHFENRCNMKRAYVLQLAFSLCLDTEADMQADITPNVLVLSRCTRLRCR